MNAVTEPQTSHPLGAHTGRMSTRVLRVAVAALVVLAGVLTGARFLLPSSSASGIDCGKIAAESAARNHVVTHNGNRSVVVLGDSYAQGYGLSDQRSSWPSYLPATVAVRSLGGTGFAASPCGPHDAYQYRAANLPAADLVVVEGGLNDVTATDAAIVSGVRATVARTGVTRTVIVGPANAPAWSARAAHVDQVLEQVSHELGIRYVSTYDWPLKFGPDRIHLAPSSHQVFGERVAQAVIG